MDHCAGLVVIGVVGIIYPPEVGIVFNGMYYTDSYSLFFKELILVCAVLISLCSTDYVKRKGYSEAEYCHPARFRHPRDDGLHRSR